MQFHAYRGGHVADLRCLMMAIMLVKKGYGMAEVTTAEAKKNLSDLLKRAQAGETITITRYGRAVATLAPPERAAPSMAEFRARHGGTRRSALDELRAMRDEEER